VRRPLIAEEEILAAIVELADDGFCRRDALALRFRQTPARELRRSVSRAVRRGLVLERRGPDGRVHLAVSSEGWQLLRSAPQPTRPGPD
jgi:hypothetical protein